MSRDHQLFICEQIMADLIWDQLPRVHTGVHLHPWQLIPLLRITEAATYRVGQMLEEGSVIA